MEKAYIHSVYKWKDDIRNDKICCWVISKLLNTSFIKEWAILCKNLLGGFTRLIVGFCFIIKAFNQMSLVKSDKLVQSLFAGHYHKTVGLYLGCLTFSNSWLWIWIPFRGTPQTEVLSFGMRHCWTRSCSALGLSHLHMRPIYLTLLLLVSLWSSPFTVVSFTSLLNHRIK